jgi:tRNA1(Val) A37 N6-methylase TrmN6
VTAAFPALLSAVQEAEQDFEWYPTTDRMIRAVAAKIPTDTESVMDIGAGDGRVLLALAKRVIKRHCSTRSRSLRS